STKGGIGPKRALESYFVVDFTHRSNFRRNLTRRIENCHAVAPPRGENPTLDRSLLRVARVTFSPAQWRSKPTPGDRLGVVPGDGSTRSEEALFRMPRRRGPGRGTLRPD